MTWYFCLLFLFFLFFLLKGLYVKLSNLALFFFCVLLISLRVPVFLLYICVSKDKKSVIPLNPLRVRNLFHLSLKQQKNQKHQKNPKKPNKNKKQKKTTNNEESSLCRCSQARTIRGSCVCVSLRGCVCVHVCLCIGYRRISEKKTTTCLPQRSTQQHTFPNTLTHTPLFSIFFLLFSLFIKKTKQKQSKAFK